MKRVSRIDLECRARGISISKLARLADVNPTSLYRIRRGLEKAYPKRGARIAAALGWEGEPEELFEFVDIEN